MILIRGVFVLDCDNEGSDGDDASASSKPLSGPRKIRAGTRRFLGGFSRGFGKAADAVRTEINRAIGASKKTRPKASAACSEEGLEEIVDHTPVPKEVAQEVYATPQVEDLPVAYEPHTAGADFKVTSEQPEYESPARAYVYGSAPALKNGPLAEEKAVSAPSDAAKLRDAMVGLFMPLNSLTKRIPREIYIPLATVLENDEWISSSREGQPYAQ